MTGRAVDVRFAGFDRAEGGRSVRAVFDVSTTTRVCRSWVTLSAGGTVVDVQASDSYDAGTTGDGDLDCLLGELAREELVRARSAAVIARFDRGEERWAA